MAKSHPKIRRRVQFYTTTLMVRVPGGLEIAPDQALFWKKIASLPFAAKAPGKKARNRQISADLFEAIDVAAITSDKYRGRFYRTRYSDFPLVGKGETDSPLKLDSDAGLRHPTHFMWWDISKKKEFNGVPAPDVGLLGIEFNLAGPRARGLEKYVHEALDDQYVLTVMPVIDPEVWKTLMSERYVKKITARVASPKSLGVQKGNLAYLDVPANLGNVEEFSWSVKPKRGHLFDLTEVSDRLSSLIESEEDVRLAVKTQDGQLIDIMETKVSGIEYVQKAEDGSRSVSAPHMYEAIKDAYGKLGSRIARGLGRLVEDEPEEL